MGWVQSSGFSFFNCREVLFTQRFCLDSITDSLPEYGVVKDAVAVKAANRNNAIIPVAA